MWQAKPPPAVLTSCMGAGLSPWSSTFGPAPSGVGSPTSGLLLALGNFNDGGKDDVGAPRAKV